MEVRATAKYVRVQPRKVRIVADEIRGTSAVHSVGLLRYQRSKGAMALRKVLISAMANAQENHGIGPENLQISTIMVDEGPRLKRMQARAMGRGNRIIKKTSHITVVVEDVEPTKAVKPHGTKAKPRPTLSAPVKGKKAAAKPAEAAVEAPKEEAIEEATPVTASEAPEENGGSAPVETTSEAVEATTDEATTEEGASEDKGAQ
jgi:large subunit ribosomal protein L22